MSDKETTNAIETLTSEVESLNRIRKSQKTDLDAADTARRDLASELANHVDINVASFDTRGSWNGLVSSVNQRLREYRTATDTRRSDGTPQATAAQAVASNGGDNALLYASIESLKRRKVKLENALLEAGIDPITVKDDEPEGFRDESHGVGGKKVKGAAEDLAEAFAGSYDTSNRDDA